MDIRETTMLKRVLTLGLLIGSSLGFAASKLSPDLPKSGPPIDVIIQFTPMPGSNNVQVVGKVGGLFKRSFRTINSVQATLPPAMLKQLASLPTVSYISPNRTMMNHVDISTQTVNANLAWPLGYDGTGVGVAVIDSGVALKHDLTAANGVTSRVVYSESFVSGQDASDGYGHGTHVAGIIGANGDDSTGPAFARTFKGVAPNVNLIHLKVLDENGMGQES